MIQWRKIISFDFNHIPKLSIGFNYSVLSSVEWVILMHKIHTCVEWWKSKSWMLIYPIFKTEEKKIRGWTKREAIFLQAALPICNQARSMQSCIYPGPHPALGVSSISMQRGEKTSSADTTNMRACIAFN